VDDFSTVDPFGGVEPFGGEVEQVPLTSSPLVGVIVQVRFPPILRIPEPPFVAAFQDSIRSSYPVTHAETTAGIVMDPSLGPQPRRTEQVWRFEDLEGNWTVSLGMGFMSLDVSRYTDRAELVERFHRVLGSLEADINPRSITRLGVRYVDRVELVADLPPLERLVRTEVLGMAGAPVGVREHMAQTLTDTLFVTDGAKLRARWGTVPAGVVLDPFHGAPPRVPSWILDLDMYGDSDRIPLDVGEVTERVGAYAARIYRFFRWVVSDEFLRWHGGEP